MSLNQKRVFSFDDFELNETDGLLWHGNGPVRLAPKGVELLAYLVRNAGQVVSNKELTDALWTKQNVNVDASNLPQQIRAVRRALGDRSPDKQYIENLPKRGYRFTAPVSERLQASALDLPNETTEPVPVVSTAFAPRPADSRHLFRFWRSKLKRVIGSALLAAICIVISEFWWLLQPDPFQTHPRIAVLAFQETGTGKSKPWVSTAIGEMIRADISTASGLRAVSGDDTARARRELRAAESPSDSPKTIARACRILGCGVVLAGHYHVSHSGDGDHLHLDLSLQDGRTETPLAHFSETGRLADLAKLAADASRRVLQHFSMNEPVDGSRSGEGWPTTAEGLRLYAEALDRWRALDPIGAKNLLVDAVQADPKSTLSHSLLAECWWRLGYSAAAQEQAKIASELTGNLSLRLALAIQGRSREMSGELESAIQAYQAVWQAAPDDYEAGLRLARAQTAAGHGTNALQTIAGIRARAGKSNPQIGLSEASAYQSLGEFSYELAAAQSSVEQSHALGNTLLEARGLQLEGWALDNIGRRKEAASANALAQSLFHTAGDADGEARVLKNIGDLLDDKGNHSGAIEAYRKAESIFELTGNSKGVAVCLNNMGYATKDSGNLDTAKSQFQRSLKLSHDIGDPIGETRAMNGLASVEWRQGDFENAARLYQEAFASWERIGDRANAAVVLGNLALVRQDQGRLGEALALFEKCERDYQQSSDRSQRIRAEGNIGMLLLLRGELDAAEVRFRRQLADAKAPPEPKQEAYALFSLGKVMQARGKLKEAEDLQSRALSLRQKAGESGLVAESQLASGQLELELNHIASAEHLALSAASQFHKESEFDEEANARILLARVRAKQGRLPEATVIEKSLPGRIAKSHDRELRINANLVTAELAIENRAPHEAVRAANLVIQLEKGNAGSESSFRARLLRDEGQLEAGDHEAARRMLETLAAAERQGFGFIAQQRASVKQLAAR